MIISDNHFFLSSSNDIDELSKPLKRLGITFFSYSKHSPDLGRIWLSNNPSMLQSYYENNYYHYGNTESTPNNYKSATLLWSTLPKQFLYEHAAAFNAHDGMFIVEPNSDGSCDFFGYATNKRNSRIVNMYLSNLDAIKNYNSYFLTKAHKLIKCAEHSKLYMPFHNDSVDFIDEVNQRDIYTLLSTTNISNNIRLSPRQLECATYLLDGKTSKQISGITGLSIRTIEYYISIMKKKLSCNHKTELVLKLYQLINAELEI